MFKAALASAYQTQPHERVGLPRGGSVMYRRTAVSILTLSMIGIETAVNIVTERKMVDILSISKLNSRLQNTKEVNFPYTKLNNL
ncbi:hypothetical protein AN618_13120 [Fervidicola ferrireducens]|uniref:Uncharacterized protein n=1 Tax=Fervidicola ferrireducens TaxID=520764 RepID=A0A140L9Q8_9FIRM|nr:hypothetical protein [Fervidicola ferrireducens]KXG77283.1 hypothetical protein AN618_13120 [Fervidicola ferrireducens]